MKASATAARGLKLRLPGFDSIVWIDKRVQAITMERQQVLSTDQRRLQVDAFARYRIVDPLRMYKSVSGNEEQVTDALRPILGSALRNELGKRSFDSLLSPERGAVMSNIRTSLDRVARNMARRSSTCGSCAPTCPTAPR